MSAFVVSDKHINTLLTWGNHCIQSIAWEDKKYYFDNTDSLQKMAEIMLTENYRSVNYRYLEQEEPHKIEFHFEPDATPIQIVKACECYDYQCCETDDWKETFAHKINEWIKESAIQRLPGYEQAKWEIR